MYQMHLILKESDVSESYRYLVLSLKHGVTYFSESVSFFKLHFDDLAEEYIKTNSLLFEERD